MHGCHHVTSIFLELYGFDWDTQPKGIKLNRQTRWCVCVGWEARMTATSSIVQMHGYIKKRAYPCLLCRLEFQRRPQKRHIRTVHAWQHPKVWSTYEVGSKLVFGNIRSFQFSSIEDVYNNIKRYKFYYIRLTFFQKSLFHKRQLRQLFEIQHNNVFSLKEKNT